MEMKLTVEIAAMYYGSEFIWRPKDMGFSHKYPVSYLFHPVYSSLIDDCKLLLKPFSEKSLTLEQRKELTKIYYKDGDGFEDDTDMFLIENISFNLFDSIKNAAECLNYLRSISIDCDNLITSGYAELNEF